MLPVMPPAGDKKSWEVTITPEGLKIKCNTSQYDNNCITKVKGKIAVTVGFSEHDSATKVFKSELGGK